VLQFLSVVVSTKAKLTHSGELGAAETHRFERARDGGRGRERREAKRAELVRTHLPARTWDGQGEKETSQSQRSCAKFNKGVSRSYVPRNKPCHKPIKWVKGFNGRFEQGRLRRVLSLIDIPPKQ
jgi:hypothetical protein